MLFIDADLRKSVMMGRHKIIGELNGLSHFLSGQVELKDVICKTQIQGLSVIMQAWCRQILQSFWETTGLRLCWTGREKPMIM